MAFYLLVLLATGTPGCSRSVRHRLIDVSLPTGVGLLLFFLAGDIPDQPG